MSFKQYFKEDKLRFPAVAPYDNFGGCPVHKLTPWLMESRGSMLHSHGLSRNPILSRINPVTRIDAILILSSLLRLGLPKGLFPVGLPVKILKALLPSSILAT